MVAHVVAPDTVEGGGGDVGSPTRSVFLLCLFLSIPRDQIFQPLSLSLSLSLFEVQPRRIVGSSSVELLVEVVTGLGFRALRVGPWGSNGVRP
jgi:hypothetical protein